MSRLSDFDPALLKEKYGLTQFVETGCFEGDGIATALELGFERIWSCDLSQEAVELCQQRFPQECVQIHNQDSLAFLTQVLPEVEGPTLFWLDAHFPSVYGLKEGVESRFPLAEELKAIRELKRGVERDLIIADDLRVIDDPQNQRWRLGEVAEDLVVRRSTLADLARGLQETHEVKQDLRAEGAIMLLPKG